MRALLTTSAVAAACSGFCPPVSASTLVYEYTGQCAYNCEEEGLAVGAPAFGKVVIDNAGYSPDGFFGNEALVDFSFNFGGIVLDKATAAAFSFGGPWEVVPGAGLVWYLGASTSVDRFDLGPTIDVSGNLVDGFGYASFLGTCELFEDSPCNVSFHTAAQFELVGAGPSPSPIPLPATGAMLIGALAMLAGIGRGQDAPMRRRRFNRAEG